MMRRPLLMAVSLGLALGGGRATAQVAAVGPGDPSTSSRTVNRSAVRADDEAGTPPPAFQVEPDEPHRYSPVKLGLLVGATGLAGAIGMSLVLYSHYEYQFDQNGNSGGSCRPCTTRQLAALRGEEYGGYAVLGVGVVLLATDIALLVLEHKYHTRHLRLLDVASGAAPAGAGWRF